MILILFQRFYKKSRKTLIGVFYFRFCQPPDNLCSDWYSESVHCFLNYKFHFRIDQFTPVPYWPGFHSRIFLWYGLWEQLELRGGYGCYGIILAIFGQLYSGYDWTGWIILVLGGFIFSIKIIKNLARPWIRMISLQQTEHHRSLVLEKEKLQNPIERSHVEKVYFKQWFSVKLLTFINNTGQLSY